MRFSIAHQAFYLPVSLHSNQVVASSILLINVTNYSQDNCPHSCQLLPIMPFNHQLVGINRSYIISRSAYRISKSAVVFNLIEAM